MNRKHLQNTFHVNADVNLMVEIIIQNKISSVIKCHYECRKPVKHLLFGEDYAWNLSIRDCECDKDCDISEHLKECTCIKKSC